MPKRFKYYFSSQIIKDNKTGQRYYGNKPLAELLNELYEDNQMLDRLVEKRDGWNNLAHERIFELEEENEQLKFENNELKCALALDGVDYIIADGKKIDIPPYYEFEQRYDSVMHRREYDGYD